MDPSLTDQRLALWLKDGNQINFSNRQAFPIFLLPTMPAVGGNRLIDQNSQLAPWTGIGNWYLCSRFFTHFVDCILNWFRNHSNKESRDELIENSVKILFASQLSHKERLSQRSGQKWMHCLCPISLTLSETLDNIRLIFTSCYTRNTHIVMYIFNIIYCNMTAKTKLK